ncbi:hypothetical protein BDZ91DRAFT_794843 [Kalaharituber pfeilii]|nr:hypothetical protein BDZ91DRAFT_794843 [Kalaharituber pfeilii]
MKKRLNKRSPTPRGEQLVARILEEWDDITGEEILESIDFMPQRVPAVIIANDSKIAISKLKRIADGYPTHEWPAQIVRDRWEERTTQGDLDIAVLWVKAHVDIQGNTQADKAAKVGTALQYQDEEVTEAGMCQFARAQRASERNRLQLTYRSLQRLATRHAVATLAGILSNKGLRQWRPRIRRADSPECRWCGKSLENTTHVLNECEVWKRRWPGGEADLRAPPKLEKEGEGDRLKEILEWAGRD